MWTEWISDESEINDQNSKAAQLYILQLYERALQDFKYPSVSNQACDFAVELYKKEFLELEKVRALFEETIKILGFDTAKGGEFWSMYIEFE